MVCLWHVGWYACARERDRPRIGMEPSRDGASAVDVVARGFFVAPTPLGGDALGPNAADATVLQGLRASTADGSGGGTSTGVCASKRFCAMHKRAMLRSRIQVRRRG